MLGRINRDALILHRAALGCCLTTQLWHEMPLGRPPQQSPWRLTHRKQGKAFFFEKKKQKAFVYADAELSE
jgi:hypothetical protein